MSGRTFGARETLGGYVTTLDSVARRGSVELARALGFAPGALMGGYVVYALADPVALPDFEWKDRTSYSDGWHFDPRIGEYVQRQDELRAHWGKRSGYDESATDARLREIMAGHVRRLNVRHGPERIVKVLARGPVSAFPDSPLRGIPQWKLRVRKSFTRLAEVGPGAVLASQPA
jgi:hypothetical protein